MISSPGAPQPLPNKHIFAKIATFIISLFSLLLFMFYLWATAMEEGW